MRLATGLGLAALVSIGACSRAPQASHTDNIFGPDNRVTPPESMPYTAVGRLDTGCTGTLIGKKLVLTAAHCAIDSATGTIQPDLGYFHPDLRNGTSKQSFWIDYIWLGTLKPEDNRIDDWAILRLDGDAEAYGHLAIQPVDMSTQLPYLTSLVGYSDDRNGGNDPSVALGCFVMEIVDGKLYHECAGASGVSGGPLFNLINSNNYIVGMTVSEFRQGASDSVHQDTYSRAYANVAVPATQFSAAAQTLIQTADAGIPAPTISGVTERSNPNQPGGQQPQPTPGPTPLPPAPPQPIPGPQPPAPPQPIPGPQPGAPTAGDIVPQPVLVQRSGAFNDLMRKMHFDTLQLNDFAIHATSQPALKQLTVQLTGAVTQLNQVYNLQLGPVPPRSYPNELFSAYYSVKGPVDWLLNNAQLPDPRGQQILNQLLGTVTWDMGELDHDLFQQ